jgi:hypothetical protein
MAVMVTSLIKTRVPRLSILLVVATLLLAGCENAGPQSPVSPVSSACPGGETTGGGAISPAAGVEGNTRYIFRCDKPAVAYTPATRDLANLAATVPGVGTMGLKSTPDTVAVFVQEHDPSVPWGTRLDAAERKMYETFAADKSMGDWFILVADVVVDGPDPIAPTAYRWTRQQVEDYVQCGIPEAETNDCSKAFYKEANVIVLAGQGGPPHGA